MNETLTAAQRLSWIGFCQCAEWRFDENEMKCCFSTHGDTTNVLYAFISEGEVLYIGKTVRPLKNRMYNYQRPGPSQRTSTRGHNLLKDLLACGKSVDVHALPDNGLLYYGGFHVNLAAGLEDSIIKELKPAWNMAGK